MAAARLEYDVVDVFTSRPFAGNPLAVVHGADGPASDGGPPLSTAQLQAIAMEFNLSETTFPVALSDPDRAAGADYRVRIFTPGGEIPFAGHPTLGTAWVLQQRGELASGPRVQACAAGLIGVDVPHDRDGHVELSAAPRDMARELSEDEVAEVAALVGLPRDDVAGPAYVAGCGLSWLFLPVRPEAVSRSRAASRQVSEAGIDLSDLKDPCDGVDVFSATVVDGVVEVESRVYVPGFGIPEDPATGSAAAGLGIVLVAAGLAGAAGQTTYRISQGVDMGRPSELLCRVEAEDGVATRCHVAGQVRHVASGTIAVPDR
jgi:trans-2,3-dihydro-3-hydroxyanthranilate isomerase